MTWGGRCGVFDIDTNGFKPPNVFGRDIFTVSYMPDGRLAPYGSQQDGGGGYLGLDPSITCVPGNGSGGGGCAAKFLYE